MMAVKLTLVGRRNLCRPFEISDLKFEIVLAARCCTVQAALDANLVFGMFVVLASAARRR